MYNEKFGEFSFAFWSLNCVGIFRSGCDFVVAITILQSFDVENNKAFSK